MHFRRSLSDESPQRQTARNTLEPPDVYVPLLNHGKCKWEPFPQVEEGPMRGYDVHNGRSAFASRSGDYVTGRDLVSLRRIEQAEGVGGSRIPLTSDRSRDYQGSLSPRMRSPCLLYQNRQSPLRRLEPSRPNPRMKARDCWPTNRGKRKTQLLRGTVYYFGEGTPGPKDE